MIGAIARVCTIYYLCSMVLKVATPCKGSMLSLQRECAIAAGVLCYPCRESDAGSL